MKITGLFKAVIKSLISQKHLTSLIHFDALICKCLGANIRNLKWDVAGQAPHQIEIKVEKKRKLIKVKIQ